jgi:hypothetical protein
MAEDNEQGNEQESARFRTAGGWHIELDIPLNKLMQEQADRGELVRVDDDGNPLAEEDQLTSSGQGVGPRDGQEGQRTPVSKPSKNGAGSSLENWRAYALSVDPSLTPEAAEEMTRADLVEKYGDHE